MKIDGQKRSAEENSIALQRKVYELNEQLNKANAQIAALNQELSKKENDLNTVREALHHEKVARYAAEGHLSKWKEVNRPTLSLCVPAEQEKYEGEYASTVICAIKVALKSSRKDANSPRRRTEDVLQGFLDANPKLCDKYAEHRELIEELRKLSNSEAVHSAKAQKTLVKLGLELVPLGNGHYNFNFRGDDRYLVREAGSGSDRRRGRGGRNETASMLHALFFSENKA